MLQIISLGMGVQSTALYLMSSLGQLPKADYAIFADTGRESTATYQYLDFLQDWKEQNGGIAIKVLNDKNLYTDLLAQKPGRFSSIPAFTKDSEAKIGMLRRQCTYEYKIQVIDNYIRDHIYGLPPYAPRPCTSIWHGITLDEMERMSIPCQAWRVNLYPFLGWATHKGGKQEQVSWGTLMDRDAVTRWYGQHHLPIPPKSSCVFCPYQSDDAWARRKKEFPEDFAAAVQVDEAIRHSSRHGGRQPLYLHRSCKPLADVQFREGNNESKTSWGECSGNCHI